MTESFFDRINKNKTLHTPDVLSCLANLSNDEVFTPPEVVNKMLDMLPQELFENPDTTFLDPVCKTGVFLREIAKRLLVGLENKIPDLQERIDHIFHRQLYGIAITELTSLLSRRSVYCSKSPNGRYSVSQFDNSEGNIRFKKTKHTWVNGKCEFCGASQKEYDRDEQLETYAYEFIHRNPEDIYKMKFDVIIGNPPYQLSDGSGGSSDSAMPIYNRFIEQAKKLNPHYLSMIVPSKWMVGGRGLNKFRDNMITDTKLRCIVDYEDAADCFSGIHIDGGVGYFLWDNTYNGKTKYKFIAKNGDIVESETYLKNDFFEYVIRDNRVLSILEKCSRDVSFNTIVSNVRPYGVRGYLFNEPHRYPESGLKDVPFYNSVRIFGVKGIKGGAKRTEGYVKRSFISNNEDTIDNYKIFFTTSYSTGAVNPPKVILAQPGEVCTETFLLVGNFKTEQEQLNCLSYIETKLFRFLLYYGKGTMHVNKTVFTLIPLQDFNEKWDDNKLYEKYNLTQKEIEFIENLVAIDSAGGEKL